MDEATSLLIENLVVLDYCSSGLDVDISSPEVSCNYTIFYVKVPDPPSGEVNLYQSVSKRFLLCTDNHPPKVSVVLHPKSNTLF